MIFHNAHRLRNVCGFKSPIGHEIEYWAGLTVELASSRLAA